MKLVHLSDLHLGKRLYDYSLLEDQRHILREILSVLDAERPDAVLIAGDVYDRSVPSEEAVRLFDDFLVSLAERKLPAFIIAGNHDSAERLSFGNRLIEQSGIVLASGYDGRAQCRTLHDEYGEVNVYLLPFLKPALVRSRFPEEEIGSYTEALAVALRGLSIDTAKRNILVTHQFVTGAERCDSEEVSVGGADNVDAEVFRDFDYVALGHLHGAQNITPRIRYCGTPLKYSISEAEHIKSVTVAELGEKGELSVRTVPLRPKRELRELRGSYEELMQKSFYEGTSYPEDYVRITLTDEDEIPEALGKLRLVYHYIMEFRYDNRRTRHSAELTAVEDVRERSPLELFMDATLSHLWNLITKSQI